MTKLTLANQIFVFLQSIGVDRVFLVPGGGNMFLVDAVATQAGIEFVATHHEQSAVIAAEYYSRVSGKIGVALVTTGPGSTNAITGIAGAWLDSIPVLILAGQVKTSDLNAGNKLRQRGPQEIDLVSMVAKISKHSMTCLVAKKCVKEIANGLKKAVQGRPGPVVFEIPLDIQSSIVDGVTTKLVEDKKITQHMVTKKTRVVTEKIFQALMVAARPLLVIGNGAKVARVHIDLRSLAESLGIPVSMTWPTMDLFEYDHELNAGRIGTVAKRFANIAVQQSDLVIVLGSRLDPVLTAHNIERFGKHAKVIVVDIEQSELDKLPSRFLKFCADLRDISQDLTKFLLSSRPEFDFSSWRLKVRELKQRYSDEVFSKRTSAYDPISIYEFIECFSEKLHGGEIIVTGSSGLSVEVFYTHFKNKIGQKTFLTTGLGAMGYGLPALLGASEATNKKVILFESDGSLMMNLQELQSLKSRGGDKLIFVMNNGGYASIRATQRNYFNGRLVATDPNSGLEIPEIKKIAACFGFDYCKISNFREMPKTVSEVVGRSGLVICEVVLQDDEVLMPKCSVFKQNDNTLVSAPLEDMSPLLPLEELSEVMEGKIESVSQTIRAQ
jgi:acetolactate synthase-1/2/3 large subunit